LYSYLPSAVHKEHSTVSPSLVLQEEAPTNEERRPDCQTLAKATGVEDGDATSSGGPEISQS